MGEHGNILGGQSLYATSASHSFYAFLATNAGDATYVMVEWYDTRKPAFHCQNKTQLFAKYMLARLNLRHFGTSTFTPFGCFWLSLQCENIGAEKGQTLRYFNLPPNTSG